MSTAISIFKPSRTLLWEILIFYIITSVLIVLEWNVKDEVDSLFILLDISLFLLLGIVVLLLWRSKVVVCVEGLAFRPFFPPRTIFIPWESIKKVETTPSKLGQIGIAVTYTDKMGGSHVRKIGVDKTSDISILQKYIPDVNYDH